MCELSRGCGRCLGRARTTKPNRSLPPSRSRSEALEPPRVAPRDVPLNLADERPDCPARPVAAVDHPDLHPAEDALHGSVVGRVGPPRTSHVVQPSWGTAGAAQLQCVVDPAVAIGPRLSAKCPLMAVCGPASGFGLGWPRGSDRTCPWGQVRRENAHRPGLGPKQFSECCLLCGRQGREVSARASNPEGGSAGSKARASSIS